MSQARKAWVNFLNEAEDQEIIFLQEQEKKQLEENISFPPTKKNKIQLTELKKELAQLLASQQSLLKKISEEKNNSIKGNLTKELEELRQKILSKNKEINELHVVIQSAEKIKSPASSITPKAIGWINRKKYRTAQAQANQKVAIETKNAEIHVRNIFVTQQAEFDNKLDQKKTETEPDLIDRMMEQIEKISSMAKDIHLQNNFIIPPKKEKDDHSPSAPPLLHEEKKNEITRLSFSEFSFYPDEDRGPLSIEGFNQLLKKINILAQNYPENLHLLLSSFPIQTDNEDLFNIAIHVQCGSPPLLTLIHKINPSNVDYKYLGWTNAYNEPFPKGIPDQMNKNLNIKIDNNVDCITVGGAQFTTAIDVCLDHFHGEAKKSFTRKASLAMNKAENIPLKMSHIVTSASIDPYPEQLLSPKIEHVDAKIDIMGIFEARRNAARHAEINHKKLNAPKLSFGTVNEIRQYDAIALNNIEGDLQLGISLNNEIGKDYYLLTSLADQEPQFKNLYNKAIYIHLLTACSQNMLDYKQVALAEQINNLIKYINQNKNNHVFDTLKFMQMLSPIYNQLDNIIKAKPPSSQLRPIAKITNGLLLKTLSGQSGMIEQDIQNLLATLDYNNQNTQLLALKFAAGAGDISSVKQGIAKLKNHDHYLESIETSLDLAASQGNTEIVKFLLDSFKDIKSKHAALEKAVIKGHAEIVKLLLKSGADLNQKNHLGLTALLVSIENNRIEIAKILLELGAKVNDTNNNNTSALCFAAQNGSVALVKLLLDYKADANATDKNGNTALMYAVINNQLLAVNLLINNTNAFKQKNNNADTILTLAAKKGNTELVKLIYSKDQSLLNQKNNQGNTALMVAVSAENEEIVNFLLTEKNIDINAKNNNNETVLMLAAQIGNANIVRSLLESKPTEINSENNNHETALLLAVKNGNTDVVRLLIDAGADLNIKGNLQNSLIDIAKNKNYRDIIDIITVAKWKLRIGSTLDKIISANPDKKNIIEECKMLQKKDVHIMDILFFSIKNKQADLLNIALERATDINTIINGETALTLAVKTNNIEGMKLLLQVNNINIDAINQMQETALIAAVKEGNIQMLSLLINKGANIYAKNKQGQTVFELIKELKRADMKEVFFEVDWQKKLSEVKTIHEALNFLENCNPDQLKKVWNKDVPNNIQKLFFESVNKDNTEAVKNFIEYLTDINFQDNQGFTALMYAISNENTSMVKLLLEANADTSIKNKFKQSPLSLVQDSEYDNPTIIQAVENHRNKPTVTMPIKNTFTTANLISRGIASDKPIEKTEAKSDKNQNSFLIDFTQDVSVPSKTSSADSKPQKLKSLIDDDDDSPSPSQRS